MTRRNIYCVLAISALFIQSCGNGDGNDAIRQFTSWDDVNANETVVIDGRVVYADYETDLNTGNTNVDSTQKDDAQASLTYDNSASLERISIDVDRGNIISSSDNPDVEFDENDGDAIDLIFGGLAGGAISASGEEVGLWAEPGALGFNYQTFGVWLTGYNTGAGVAAAGSFGSMTPETDVPSMDVATYNGAASGFAVDDTGTPFLVVSDAEVMLNFDDGTFAFGTTNSAKDNLVDADLLLFAADSGFNLSGDGNIVGNILEGEVETTGYDMMGDIDGSLYGPTGSEVGGLFDLAGPDGRYAGSFGAVD